MSPYTRTRATTEHRFSRRRFLYQTGQIAGVASLAPTVLGGYSAHSLQVFPGITATDLSGLTLLQGAGCNVIAMAGEDGTGSETGALMVDGGLRSNADALLRAVRNATGNSRVHTLINTHWHPEQTGSNEAVGRDGGVIIAHEKTRMYLSNRVTSVTFEGRLEPLPEVARPNQTVSTDGSLEFVGDRVDYGYLPAAHTDGDLYVHFPEMDILVAGGVVSAETWPVLDHRNGAWMGGRVRALEHLADLVSPDTRVVPAEGRLMTGGDVIRHRNIYQELFLEFIDYMNMGMGPEDAVERNPLEAYEAELGDATEFLYGAYRSMLLAYVPD